jgi:hypothetical protein
MSTTSENDPTGNETSNVTTSTKNVTATDARKPLKPGHPSELSLWWWEKRYRDTLKMGSVLPIFTTRRIRAAYVCGNVNPDCKGRQLRHYP